MFVHKTIRIMLLNCSHVYTGVYCPISDHKVIASVAVKGRQGIWRLVSGKYDKQGLLGEMNGDLIEQPELQNFFLTELHSGE